MVKRTSHRKMKRAHIIAVASMFAFIAGPVAAQSLKEARAQRAENEALKSEAAYTESVCGSSINASIDWRSSSDWPENVSLAKSCDGALGALEAICRNQAGKTKAKKINRFVCSGDGSGPSLRGSTLRYGASPGANGFSATKALLDSEL